MKLAPAAAAAIAGDAMVRRTVAVPLPSIDGPRSIFSAPTRSKSAVHKIILGLVWLTVFSGFFVVREPAPFDVLMLGLIFLLPVSGLTAINATHLTYLILWLVVIAAGFIATISATVPNTSSIHLGVTLYLAIASFVIAAFIAKSPVEHSRMVFRAYVAAAIIASTLALVGYFDLIPGTRNLFTVHSRAAGTFKDPNVFAAFLVPPMLYLLNEALTRGAFGTLRATFALLIMSFALLLSFSRGGWINLAVSMAVLLPLSFVTAGTDRQRARLFGFSILMAAVAALLVLLALESDAVAKLFQQRASMDQSYDHGPEGRFGGQMKAIDFILQYPFGLGALQFGGIHHPEHPHNVYISQFLNGGWIGGLTYIIIVLASIVVGARAVLRRTWSARSLLVVYAALIGLVVEGFVVETDHWRAFYIVFGLVWGLASSAGSGEPVAAVQRTALPIRLAMMPLRPPSRRPRIVARNRLVRMMATAPKRKRRRREPKRKARIIVH